MSEKQEKHSIESEESLEMLFSKLKELDSKIDPLFFQLDDLETQAQVIRDKITEKGQKAVEELKKYDQTPERQKIRTERISSIANKLAPREMKKNRVSNE